MKAILLAAGQGQPQHPSPRDRPRCMVEVGGRPLLHWQLDALRSVGFEDIVVVRGWCRSRIVAQGVRYLDNRKFATTDMVESLRCARRELRGDLLVVDADLLHDPAVLMAARSSPADIAVPVDLDWRAHTERRHGGAGAKLDQAVSLRMGEHGELLDIGRRVEDLDEVEAGFMGLLRLSPRGSDTLRGFLCGAGDGDEAPDRASLIDLLQQLVDRGEHVKAVPLRGGWCGVEGPRDRELATRLLDRGGFPDLSPLRGAVA